IRYLTREELGPIPETVEAFLQQLGGPTWIHIKGQNSHRNRVLVTLLHGNEPSGCIALHQWLREDQQPIVDLYCFIASVAAALTPPLFSHRMPVGRRDLNRCFKPPFEGPEGALARACLEQIEQLRPEAVVDIHNTSGDGPAFGVSACESRAHNALTACFTHRLVITDLQMGALLEAARDDLPLVTVEVGGSQEESSHQVAYEGLCHYFFTDNLYAPDISAEVFEVLKHPLRLELTEGASISYNNRPQAGFDVTISDDIERHNFGLVTTETTLGWLGEQGLRALSVIDAQGQNRVEQYFASVQNALRPHQPLKLFMATPNPELAAGDCLCYFLPLGPAQETARS
ncbi:MAG: succinylglutamate desuccinylase, partial [Gammaproteobacteria bacterium]|nr:succinylglutamate desuccinylase [Gammaproteobacteria bacterium]